jgi:hypothetical protein
MHRLYGSVKLAPHRPTKEEKRTKNFRPFLGTMPLLKPLPKWLVSVTEQSRMLTVSEKLWKRFKKFLPKRQSGYCVVGFGMR